VSNYRVVFTPVTDPTTHIAAHDISATFARCPNGTRVLGGGYSLVDNPSVGGDRALV
jgi:hypothetical protein